MRQDVMMCCLSPWPCVPCHEVRLFWPRRSVRSRGAIVRSLPKGGSSRGVLMAFTAGSPPGFSLPFPLFVIKFHPTSKRHTFHLAALTFSHLPSTPQKEIRHSLASHKAPGRHFSQHICSCKGCGRSERPAAWAFPGNLRKHIGYGS